MLDAFRHAQGFCQLPHLGLVQVAQRVERAGGIPVQCGVAQQGFGFVACANHQPSKGCRLVKQDNHAGARHDVATPQAVHLRKPVDEAERIIDKEIWPMPTYSDLLFEV